MSKESLGEVRWLMKSLDFPFHFLFFGSFYDFFSEFLGTSLGLETMSLASGAGRMYQLELCDRRTCSATTPQNCQKSSH